MTCPIIASDILPKAIEIARDNAKSAGVERYITFETKSIVKWEAAPQPAGVLVTNPPYGKRISVEDMNALYKTIGTILKRVFTGYHAWIIGYEDEYFHEIGLAPSQKIAVNNGGLDCELREYLLFAGNKKSFRAEGGKIKEERRDAPSDKRRQERKPRFNDRDRKPGKKRDERPEKRYDRRPERSEEAVKEERRKPFSLKRPTMPSISADKEIVVNRPAWRVRKKRDDNK